MKLGIVGSGFVTRQVHLPLLLEHPDRFTLAGICDLDPVAAAWAAGRAGLPTTAVHHTLDDLIASETCDAVLIATSGSHGHLAAQAAAADLHVLVEKPLGFGLAELDAIPDSGILQVGYMKLHDPAVHWVRRRLVELGAPTAIEVTVLHPSMERQVNHVRSRSSLSVGGPPSIEARAEASAHKAEAQRAALGPDLAAAHGDFYTDVVLGSIVHDLAVIRDLVGPVTAVHHVADRDLGTGRVVTIAGEVDESIPLHISWCYLPGYPSYHEEVSIHTPTGSVRLDFPTPYVLHGQTAASSTVAIDGDESVLRFSTFGEAFELQLLDFARRVQTGSGQAGVDKAGARNDTESALRILSRLADQHDLAIGGDAASLSPA